MTKITASEAKKLIDLVGPHIGCGDLTFPPVFPEGRTDVCAVRRMAENGSSKGYDTIYVVWREPDGFLRALNIADSKGSTHYIPIGSVDMTEDCEVSVKFKHGGGYCGAPWSVDEKPLIERETRDSISVQLREMPVEIGYPEDEEEFSLQLLPFKALEILRGLQGLNDGRGWRFDNKEIETPWRGNFMLVRLPPDRPYHYSEVPAQLKQKGTIPQGQWIVPFMEKYPLPPDRWFKKRGIYPSRDGIRDLKMYIAIADDSWVSPGENRNFPTVAGWKLFLNGGGMFDDMYRWIVGVRE